MLAIWIMAASYAGGHTQNCQHSPLPRFCGRGRGHMRELKTRQKKFCRFLEMAAVRSTDGHLQKTEKLPPSRFWEGRPGGMGILCLQPKRSIRINRFGLA